jgi:hypothetical protein
VARRVSLPAADDLFGRNHRTHDDRQEAPPVVRAVPDQDGAEGDDAAGEPSGRRRPSGRVKHDEKMTVYVTSTELLELEQTRLSLRGKHGLAVDRGRLVREAVAMVLADYQDRGEGSALVRRLRDED